VQRLNVAFRILFCQITTKQTKKGRPLNEAAPM